MKSPIPKERLRVSNWIVQRLYNYAVNETGVVARLVLHGAVLRFRVHRDRLATSFRLVLDFRPLCDNLLAALDAARSASTAARSFMRPATSEFVVVRANARIWAARSRQCAGHL